MSSINKFIQHMRDNAYEVTERIKHENHKEHGECEELMFTGGIVGDDINIFVSQSGYEILEWYTSGREPADWLEAMLGQPNAPDFDLSWWKLNERDFMPKDYEVVCNECGSTETITAHPVYSDGDPDIEEWVCHYCRNKPNEFE